MQHEGPPPYIHPSVYQPGISQCYFTQFTPHAQLPLNMRSEVYTQGHDTGLHLHADFYALYIVQGGSGIHLINGHPYGITRGDVYVLPPGSIHAYQDFHALTIQACYFQPRLFSSVELDALRALSGFWHLVIKAETLSTQQNTLQAIDHQLHLPPELYQHVATQLHEIHQEFFNPAPEAALLTQSLFFRLLVHLARWQAHDQPQNPSTLQPSGHVTAQKMEIAMIIRFCEEHFHEEITVPQLAAMLFLSPGRFTELFIREVRISPAAYIRRLRLERARTLLRTTDASTTSIAHDVGFRDSSQFSRAFRATFRLTPTDYRSTFRHTRA